MKGFRIVVEEYKGLNVKDGRLFLDPAFAQVSQNFEYRRKGAARVRPGYARLVTDALPDTVVTETLVASDAFNRANGGLGANWTNRGSGGLLIASNEVYTGSINVFDGAEYASGSFANDQYSLAECRRVDPLVGSYFGLLLRCSSTRAYIGAVLPAGYVIVRITWPGSPVLLADLVAPSPLAVSDVLKFRVVGSTLSLLKNGTTKLSVVDTTYASGRPGILIKGSAVGLGSTWRIDNWEGGDISTSQTYASVTGDPSVAGVLERDDDQVKLLVGADSRILAFNVGLPEWST